jgi:CheY-like chemotaxis protein
VLTRAGCHVDVANNGIEACAMSATGAYDLVLMDCHMPEMDGYQATRAIRQRERSEHATGGSDRHVPIVALTASVLEVDRERCFASGMDDFISKPFRPEQLHAALRRWTVPNDSEGPLREAA